MSKAIHLSNDWHLAHTQDKKYAMVEQGTVAYKPCLQCGKQMLPTPAPLMQLAYQGDSKQIETLRQLCSDCRRSASAGGKP